jgi:hypothetical protein
MQKTSVLPLVKPRTPQVEHVDMCFRFDDDDAWQTKLCQVDDKKTEEKKKTHSR